MDELNDNLTDSTPSGEMNAPIGDDADGYGEDSVLDLIAAEGLEKKKKTGALVIVAVVVVAAASLFSMHTLTKVHAGGESNPNDTKTVDDWLLVDQATVKPKVTEIIEGLRIDYTEGQVPVSELKVDPFPPEIHATGPAGPVQGSGCEDQLRSAAKELKLNSVLLGSTPTAIISGKLARLNREVTITVRNTKVAFLVTVITADSATVVAKCPDSDVKIETTIFIKRW